MRRLLDSRLQSMVRRTVTCWCDPARVGPEKDAPSKAVCEFPAEMGAGLIAEVAPTELDMWAGELT